ncbi:MAG: stage III sporulation protein AF [Clostridiales bacterium]|uniref:stage III sporulation protein AF n=1 Tax=Evtepia sp. TaxID=2773933 RepID=UPI0029876278|nr:stage III sporulation protein AF [Evtepia sp.]MDD7288439.1 stage III sporulation protein AF [Clostridiales bacterium]MDY3992415.1 stage III sporulation protein AF [Evtepia sp.]MDY4430385.1 stage III sporulation protein AF [Evtepia sp.]
MELIRTWILTVTVSALVIAGAEALMPQGSVKRVGKLTGGLILVLGILQPLVTMDYDQLYDLVNTLPAGSIRQETLDQAAREPMKGIIEEELAAYIVDKGAQLGLTCTARVTCETGEDGVPLPKSVTVTGTMSPDQQEQLCQAITQDLGLAREDQIYISEETP